MKKQVKILLLIAMICVLALATMLVSSALDAEQGDNAWQVVGKGYAATLQDAVDAADAGDTVKLLKDVTNATPVTVSKNLTIDGQGFSISFADMTPAEGEDAVLVTFNAASATVTNVKLTAATSDFLFRNTYTDGVLVLNDLVVVNASCAYHFGTVGSHVKFTGAKTDITTKNQLVYSANDAIATGTVKVTVDIAGGQMNSTGSDGFRLTGNNVELTVLGGTFAASDVFYIPSGYTGGKVTICGTTTINARSDGMCFGPVTIEFYGNVTINAPEGNGVVLTEGANLSVAGKFTVTAYTNGIVFNSGGAGDGTTGTVVLGTAAGQDKNDVKDDIYVVTSRAANSKNSVPVKISNQSSNVTIWSGYYSGMDMALFISQTSSADVEERVDVTINGGKFLTSGQWNAGGYNSGIYFRGHTLTINGGFFSFVDVDPENISFTTSYGNGLYYYDTAKTDGTLKTGLVYTCIPVNVASNAGSCSPVVKITGGFFFCGNSNGTVMLSEENSTLTVTGGTHYGYSWLRTGATGSTINVYGGEYYSNPNQANCHGLRVGSAGITLNVYGGRFEVMQNADSGTGVIYAGTASTITVYGGEFISRSTNTSMGIVRVGHADAVVTFKVAGSAYKNADGTDAVSEGATLTRANVDTFVYFAAAGTVSIEGGNALQWSGVDAPSFANVAKNADGITGNFTMGNTEVGGQTKYLTLIIDDTPWFLTSDEAIYNVEIRSWRGISLDSTGFSSGVTGYTFDGTFNGDQAAFRDLIENYINWQLLEVAGVYDFPSSEDLASMLGKPRQNLFFNLQGLSSVTIDGANVTVDGLTGTSVGTVFTVNSGSLTLTNANIDLASNDSFIVLNSGAVTIGSGTYTKTYAKEQRTAIITVYTGTLTINGGTFEARSGGSIVYYDENRALGTSTTVVNGGIFNIPNPEQGGNASYYSGGIFFVGADAGVGHVGTLNIYNGSFTATGFVRNYSTAVDANDATLPHETEKFVANIYGGTFVGNALKGINSNNRYMFQIARIGKHEINFVEGGTATLSAGAYGYFFNANASANGCTFNILSGTFDGSMRWINSGKVATWNIANATFKDTKGVMSGSGMYFSAVVNTVNITNAIFELSCAKPWIETDDVAHVITVSGATVKLANGATLTTLGASAVFAMTDSTVYIGEGAALPADAAIWANTQFVLQGSADAAVLENGDNFTVTDLASAIAAANAALLRAYAANTYIKPNVNLTMALETVVPFTVNTGATLTLNWPELTYTGGFLTVNGGNVTIECGTFVTEDASKILTLNSGTLTVNGGSYTKTNTGAWNTGIAFVGGGTLNVTDGTFLQHDGGSMFRFEGEGITANISGGSYTILAPAQGGGSSYYVGGIFYIGSPGSVTNAASGELRISAGEFSAAGIVRIYAIYTKDGTYTADSEAHTEKGFKAYISGGTFHGVADANVGTNDRYMFQIARPGAHLIEFTKGGTATVEASAYTQIFMFDASAVVELGATINVYSGVFDGGCNWFGGNKIITLNIDGATFKDTKSVTTGTGSYSAIYATAGSKITIKNTTFSASSVSTGFWYTNSANADITFENCVIETNELIYTVVENANMTFKNTLIIVTGADDVIFDTVTPVLENVTVIIPANNGATKPTESHVVIDAYAPIVRYAGIEFKAWSVNKASGENASVTDAVALYADTAAAETSGIRFISTVSADVVAALTAGGKTLKFGTLVAPADYVAKAKTFTPEALEAAFGQGVISYVKIPAVYSLVTDGEGNVSFSGILVNLKSNTRVYAAVSYIEVYEGETLVDTVYSAYDAQQNAKSAEQMADAIVADAEAYAALDEGEKAIVDAYANGKVEVVIPEPVE
ncbi:MAG: hypothetical protein E7650_02840 [Ruminococcaceae bacterium]|nr:hypothetical protein [Oscillospiraceae bacterium]